MSNYTYRVADLRNTSNKKICAYLMIYIYMHVKRDLKFTAERKLF